MCAKAIAGAYGSSARMQGVCQVVVGMVIVAGVGQLATSLGIRIAFSKIRANLF